MNKDYFKTTILWLKLIFSVILMFVVLAIFLYFILGFRFVTFWSQIALLFVSIIIGIMGVLIAFRTKILVIK